MNTRILYDRQGAADMLSCSVHRIDELRRSGKLIAVLDGQRQYKYLHSALVKYAESLPTSTEAVSA